MNVLVHTHSHARKHTHTHTYRQRKQVNTHMVEEDNNLTDWKNKRQVRQPLHTHTRTHTNTRAHPPEHNGHKYYICGNANDCQNGCMSHAHCWHTTCHPKPAPRIRIWFSNSCSYSFECPKRNVHIKYSTCHSRGMRQPTLCHSGARVICLWPIAKSMSKSDVKIKTKIYVDFKWLLKKVMFLSRISIYNIKKEFTFYNYVLYIIRYSTISFYWSTNSWATYLKNIQQLTSV